MALAVQDKAGYPQAVIFIADPYGQPQHAGNRRVRRAVR